MGEYRKRTSQDHLEMKWTLGSLPAAEINVILLGGRRRLPQMKDPSRSSRTILRTIRSLACVFAVAACVRFASGEAQAKNFQGGGHYGGGSHCGGCGWGGGGWGGGGWGAFRPVPNTTPATSTPSNCG
jgi:hypothetical protein